MFNNVDDVDRRINEYDQNAINSIFYQNCIHCNDNGIDSTNGTGQECEQ